MSLKKRISILGCTGSIGASTLDIIRQHPDTFELVACTANQNAQALAEICDEFSPTHAALAMEDKQANLATLLADSKTTPIDGVEALLEAARIPADIVVAGMVGASGVAPIMAALQAGSNVALANKEALVCAGPQVLAAAKAHDAMLLPVDSEHNAVFQLWNGNHKAQLAGITLTASGGPFLQRPLDTFTAVTPEEAVAHPNWDMGAKISVDSATMMNKALELIEAHYLFDVRAEQLDAVIHPQSLVHAFVSYDDGSTLAQLGQPDMRVPIAYALSWPERLASNVSPLSLGDMQDLQFSKVDEKRFPLFSIGLEALKAGQAAMVALNAANEMAVAAFLNKQIGFLDIASVVQGSLDKQRPSRLDSVEEVLAWDGESRHHAATLIKGS